MAVIALVEVLRHSFEKLSKDQVFKSISPVQLFFSTSLIDWFRKLVLSSQMRYNTVNVRELVTCVFPPFEFSSAPCKANLTPDWPLWLSDSC